jgi:hypothetical protein
MLLSEAGEGRVRGYLYVLDRALRTFLPRDFVSDAVREIEAHIRERVSRSDAQPDERAALELILLELGPPQRVAQAYSAELTIDEAVTTGRIGPTFRSIWYTAVNSVVGFFGAIGLFIGYSFGIAFVATAALKPIFPDNVGFMWANGRSRAGTGWCRRRWRWACSSWSAPIASRGGSLRGSATAGPLAGPKCDAEDSGAGYGCLTNVHVLPPSAVR